MSGKFLHSTEGMETPQNPPELPIELELPTQPPKKRRGRPRKNPLDKAEVSAVALKIPKKNARKPDDSIPSEERMFTDFETYSKELLWIRNKAGDIIPFHWNFIQKNIDEQINRGKELGFKHFMILKYRRGGITTYFQARSFFRSANREGQYCVTLAHDNISTAKIFEISQLFYNKLPEWARPKRKTENKRELNFPGLLSQFYIGTAGSEDFGRGSTFQSVHGSECAFWPKSTDVANLMAGLQEATSHGELFLESTANGVGNWYHKTWMGAKSGENRYYPIFLPWHLDPTLTLYTEKDLDALNLDVKEEELAKKYNLAPGQILWRRLKMKELYDVDRGNSTFHQEYPINDVEAFISSGACFFDVEIIQHLANLCSAPVQTADSGRLKIFKLPIEYHQYVVAIDIGEGVIDGDKTAITVMDTNDCEEVASWVGICSPEDAARKAADLGNLYNRALIAPEANSFGHSTVNTLLNELSYPHIYQHTDYQAVRIKSDTEVTPKFGWQTTPKTRPILLSEFREALQGGYYKANDPELLNECMSFVDTGHGRYEAARGSHDDRLISHAIAWQARKRQIDLREFQNFAVDTGHHSILSRWEDI